MLKQKITGLLLLAATTTGCAAGVENKAIVTANEVREVAQTENNIINGYCIPKYKGAVTKKQIDDIDKICLPARDSYYAVKSAWELLVVVLNEAKVGKFSEAEIQDAALKLINALVELRRIVEVM